MVDSPPDGDTPRDGLPALPGAPPSSQRLRAAAPKPSLDGFMSDEAKLDLAAIALALRDEQLSAKVIHYKAELETSPELDAITDQVVRELEDLQRAAARKSIAPPGDRGGVERDLIENLEAMLARIFRRERIATHVQRRLVKVGKRFARVFFESELHDRIRGSKRDPKVMRFADQALFHVLSRNRDYLVRQIDSYEHDSRETRDAAVRALDKRISDVRNDFLARTTPELNRLVQFLDESMRAFCLDAMPRELAALSREVVHDAHLAEARTTPTYKLSASAFPKFRKAFERRFVQRLVPFVEEEMLRRIRESDVEFRTETLRFVSDPQIFSDTCEVLCDAVYDILYSDGFLDLPDNWREHLAKQAP